LPRPRGNIGGVRLPGCNDKKRDGALRRKEMKKTDDDCGPEFSSCDPRREGTLSIVEDVCRERKVERWPTHLPGYLPGRRERTFRPQKGPPIFKMDIPAAVEEEDAELLCRIAQVKPKMRRKEDSFAQKKTAQKNR